MKSFETHGEEETIELGRRIAATLPRRAVVLLIGNLGAGKTTLAKGGTGDVLTGLIAGLIAQTRDIGLAVRSAVWLHGRAGELAAEKMTEYCVLARDLLTYLPRAIREVL